MLDKIYQFCKEYIENNISSNLGEAEACYHNLKGHPIYVGCHLYCYKIQISVFDDLKPELEFDSVSLNLEQAREFYKNFENAITFLKDIEIFISELKDES